MTKSEERNIDRKGKKKKCQTVTLSLRYIARQSIEEGEGVQKLTQLPEGFSGRETG